MGRSIHYIIVENTKSLALRIFLVTDHWHYVIVFLVFTLFDIKSSYNHVALINLSSAPLDKLPTLRL